MQKSACIAEISTKVMGDYFLCSHSTDAFCVIKDASYKLFKMFQFFMAHSVHEIN